MTEHHHHKMMLHLVKICGFALGVIQGLIHDVTDTVMKERLSTIAHDIEILLDETIGQMHEPR